MRWARRRRAGAAEGVGAQDAVDGPAARRARMRLTDRRDGSTRQQRWPAALSRAHAAPRASIAGCGRQQSRAPRRSPRPGPAAARARSPAPLRRRQRLAAFLLAIDREHHRARRAPPAPRRPREPRTRSRPSRKGRGSSRADSSQASAPTSSSISFTPTGGSRSANCSGVADRCRSVTTCSSVLRRSLPSHDGALVISMP